MRSPAVRPLAARAPRLARRLSLAVVAVTAAWGAPLQAQTPGPNCNCGPTVARDSLAIQGKDDGGIPWWIGAFFIPFLAPQFGGPGGGGPGASAAPTLGPGISSSAREMLPAGEPRVATGPGLSSYPSSGPETRRFTASQGEPPVAARLRAYRAPNTATARPALLLGGAALVLLGLLTHGARRRAAVRRMVRQAAAARAAHANTPPRVALTPTMTAAQRAWRPSLRERWHAPAVGHSLVVAGLCCVGAVGVAMARGAVAASQVRANWARSTAAAAAVPAGGVEIAAVARLEIPAIGLASLVGEGTDDRTLAAGPGHMPATVAPGLPDLSVISAHRDLDFRGLGRLELGDTVVTTTRTQRTVWRVVERTVVPRDSAALVPAAGRARLALTTCWPIRYLGSAPDRLLVYAEPVSTTPAPPEPGRERAVAGA
jgi:LPXTG-site transpeptidase (sortase) family protein